MEVPRRFLIIFSQEITTMGVIQVLSAFNKTRSVIIIPEFAFNMRWGDIVTKISTFANSKTQKTVIIVSRNKDEELPYSKIVKIDEGINGQLQK